MKLTIKHQTLYVYDQPVEYSIQNLRLSPKNNNFQKVIKWEINSIGKMHRHMDVFGNINHRLTINEPHQKILISAEGCIETNVEINKRQNELIKPELFLKNTPLTKSNLSIHRFVKKLKIKCINTQAIKDLGKAIINEVEYRQGTTEAQTSAQESFKLKKGVCQDHSHIMIACCHELGLPARYVSGYLLTDSHNETQTHAWVDIFIDNQWKSYDISNQCLVDDRYVSLAIGLDYKTAAPIIGIRHGGGNEGMASEVSVSNRTKQQKINVIKLEKSALEMQAQQ